MPALTTTRADGADHDSTGGKTRQSGLRVSAVTRRRPFLACERPDSQPSGDRATKHKSCDRVAPRTVGFTRSRHPKVAWSLAEAVVGFSRTSDAGC